MCSPTSEDVIMYTARSGAIEIDKFRCSKNYKSVRTRVALTFFSGRCWKKDPRLTSRDLQVRKTLSSKPYKSLNLTKCLLKFNARELVVLTLENGCQKYISKLAVMTRNEYWMIDRACFHTSSICSNQIAR